MGQTYIFSKPKKDILGIIETQIDKNLDESSGCVDG